MLFEKTLRAYHGKTQDKTLTLTDGKGLGVRVSVTGKMRFQFRYKIKGQNKRIDLGDYPDLSLRQARDAMEECRTWLAQGFDPKIRRDMTRQESLVPVTVKQALDYWIKEYVEDNRANPNAVKLQFAKHIYPYIGNFSLVDTETRHWIECFDRIRRGDVKLGQKACPYTAGSVLQSAKQALKFCRVRRYGISHALDDLNRADVGTKQNEVDRILSDMELRELLNHINGRKMPFYLRYLCKFLIIYGARTREVRLSKFDEWDLDNGIWKVPKLHSKSKKVIIRPIPEEVKLLVEFLFRRHGQTGYLLGELRCCESVSGSGAKIYRRLKHREAWTLHDIRRTFITRLNDLGVAPYIVEQLVGHELVGVMKIYNRSQYIPEKKVALDMWVERLKMLEDKPDNVSILKRTA